MNDSFPGVEYVDEASGEVKEARASQEVVRLDIYLPGGSMISSGIALLGGSSNG